MLARPRLKARLRAAIAPPDLVFFLREIGYTVEEGRLLPLLVPLLDGHRTVEEIIDRLSPEAGPADVLYGLSLLERLDLLAEGDESSLPPDFGAARRLVDLLRRLCDPEGDGVEIVLTDDYGAPELIEVARDASDSAAAWMPAKPADDRLWIGPVFGSRGGTCWNCLVHRLRSNRPEEALLSSLGATDASRFRRGKGFLSTAEIAGSIRLLERALADGLDRLPPAAMLTIDPSGCWRAHTLVPRSTCRRCGPRIQEKKASVSSLRSSGNGEIASTDGGYRSVPPEITVQRYRHLVSPAIGIVSSLERSTPPSADGVEIFTATLPVPADATRRELVHHGLRRRTAGKGLGRSQAQASALCEALERWSGQYRREPVSCRGSSEEMAGEAVDPETVMRFSRRQYESRDRWNGSGHRYLRVPRRFDPARAIDWVPLWSLTRHRHRFLPASFCYYGHPAAAIEGTIADSNGCAAGNTLAEAVLQGLLELVERDCVAIWWYNRIPRPTVALDALDRRIAVPLEPHHARQRVIRIFDIGNDLAIPAFAAVSWARGGPREELLLGAGAHPDPRIALGRAVTEMNQFLPSLLAGGLRPLFAGTLAETAFLEAESATVSAEVSRDTPPPASVDTALDECIGHLARRGLEVLILDQTRPEVDLPVVRVVVPGLRHFWPRFGPGRLYDVPVELGWLPEPRTEDALNPAWIVI